MPSIDKYKALLDHRDGWITSKKVVLENGELHVLGFWDRMIRLFTTGSDDRKTQNIETINAFKEALAEETNVRFLQPNENLGSWIRDGKALRLRDVRSLLKNCEIYDEHYNKKFDLHTKDAHRVQKAVRAAYEKEKNLEGATITEEKPVDEWRDAHLANTHQSKLYANGNRPSLTQTQTAEQKEAANKQMHDTSGHILASSSNPPLGSGTKSNLPVSAEKTVDLASVVKTFPPPNSSIQTTTEQDSAGLLSAPGNLSESPLAPVKRENNETVENIISLAHPTPVETSAQPQVTEKDKVPTTSIQNNGATPISPHQQQKQTKKIVSSSDPHANRTAVKTHVQPQTGKKKKTATASIQNKDATSISSHQQQKQTKKLVSSSDPHANRAAVKTHVQPQTGKKKKTATASIQNKDATSISSHQQQKQTKKTASSQVRQENKLLGRRIPAAGEDKQKQQLSSFFTKAFGGRDEHGAKVNEIANKESVKEIRDEFGMTANEALSIYYCTLEDSTTKGAQAIPPPISKENINNALNQPSKEDSGINAMIQAAITSLNKLPDYTGPLYVTANSTQASNTKKEFRIMTSAKPTYELDKYTLVYNMRESVCKDISSFYENENKIKTYVVMPNAEHHKTSTTGFRTAMADGETVTRGVTVEYDVTPALISHKT